MDKYVFLFLTAAYGIHIAEEFFLDFRSWVARVTGFRIEWREFAIANTVVIAIGVAASFIGFSIPMLSYLFVGLAVVNGVVAHLATTIIKRRFSPGLISSIVLFVPLGVWAYYIAAQRGILTITLFSVSLIGGFAIMCVPIIRAKLLRDAKKQ